MFILILNLIDIAFHSITFRLALFSAIAFNSYQIESQERTEYLRIQFADKGIYGNSIDTEAEYQIALSQLSQSTIKRRILQYDYLKSDSRVASFEDLPVSDEYIDNIIQMGGEYEVSSRWYNYAVFGFVGDRDSLIEIIANLDFTDRVEWIGQPLGVGGIEEIQVDSVTDQHHLLSGCDSTLAYRFSTNQLSRLQIMDLHKKGWAGQGVNIALIDNGFITTHDDIQHILLNDVYDFIQRDETVSNQEGDADNQDDHGTYVLGTIAAFHPGVFIGSAPLATFSLYKTEVMQSETPLEVEYLIAAIERAERTGADIISVSLGYRYFDQPFDEFETEDLDGITVGASIAFDRASDLGVICVSSAGNSGDTQTTIGSPADSRKGIAVGALNSSHTRNTSFSSFGPTADGRPKPDIFAQGSRVTTISPFNNTSYSQVNGTSFSAPIVAGLLASMMSSMPDIAPDSLKKVFLNSQGDMRYGRDSVAGYPLVYDASSDVRPVPTIPMYYDLYEDGIKYRRFFIQYDESQFESIDDILQRLQILDPDNNPETFYLKRYFDSGIFYCDIDKSKYGDSVYVALDLSDVHRPNRLIYHAYANQTINSDFTLCELELPDLSDVSPEAFLDNFNQPFDIKFFAHFRSDSDLEILYQFSASANVSFALHDVNGKLISKEERLIGNGVDKLTLGNFNTLAIGNYFLQYRVGESQLETIIIPKR
jgi:subtilisin family serine protease